MIHTRCRQFLLLMVDLETLNNEEKQVEERKKVAPPLEAPLMEAPAQESSSLRANGGTRSVNHRKKSNLEDSKH
jgi:hypothetical protein